MPQHLSPNSTAAASGAFPSPSSAKAASSERWPAGGPKAGLPRSPHEAQKQAHAMAAPRSPSVPSASAARANRVRRNGAAEAWGERKGSKDSTSSKRSSSAAATTLRNPWARAGAAVLSTARGSAEVGDRVALAAARAVGAAGGAFADAEATAGDRLHLVYTVMRNSRLHRFLQGPRSARPDNEDGEVRKTMSLEERLETSRLNVTRVKSVGDATDRHLIFTRWITQVAKNLHLERRTYRNRQKKDFMKIGTETREILREAFLDVRKAVKICCGAYRAVEMMQDSVMMTRMRTQENIRRMRPKVIAVNQVCNLHNEVREAREAEEQWRSCLDAIATGSRSSALGSMALGSQNAGTFSVEIARLQSQVDLKKGRLCRPASSKLAVPLPPLSVTRGAVTLNHGLQDVPGMIGGQDLPGQVASLPPLSPQRSHDLPASLLAH